MRKRSRVRMLFWSAVASFIAALGVAFTITTAGACYARHYPDQGAYHECVALAYVLLRETAGWLGEHLEAVGIVLTGIFTWSVARYTHQLADSTRKLFLAGEKQIEVARLSAEAANKSADAAVAAERAWISAIVSGDNIGNVLAGARMYDNTPEMHPGAAEKPVATFYIENFGRTQAVITSIASGDFICAEGPQDLAFTEQIIRDGDVVLAVNTRTDTSYTIKMTLPFTFGECRDIVKGEKWFWCGVRIEYRDVFGNPHTSRLYCRTNGRVRFQQYDYKHYNHST